MRYLLLSVLVVCVIGVMIPSAFGLFHSSPIGESIIKEKECDAIGKEIDSNIECKLFIKNWFAPGYQPLMPSYYDSANDLMYFYLGAFSDWDVHYVTVEMDNFTIVDEVKCDGVTTGTYVQAQQTTYPCKHDPDQDYQKGEIRSGTVELLVQSQTTTPYQYKIMPKSYKLHVFSEERVIEDCPQWDRDGKNCIIEDGKEVPIQSIHTYRTDLPLDRGMIKPRVFLNEDRNELYYFMCEHTSITERNIRNQSSEGHCIIYLINGMGELKSAAASSEPEPSGGCGEGTELVNGVCQLTKTSGTSQEDSFGVSNLVSVIVIIIAIVGTIALVKSRKKKSSITQPAPEKIKPKPRRKPAESRPTSSSCSNCGKKLKPTAKFCGGCGTPVS